MDKIHHFGFVVSNIETSLDFFKSFLNCTQTTEILDESNQKVKVVFLKSSQEDVMFELIEPSGPDSPVYNHMKKGGGFSHICFEVENIEKSISKYQKNGFKQIGSVKESTIFKGKKVAFLFNKNIHLIELIGI